MGRLIAFLRSPDFKWFCATMLLVVPFYAYIFARVVGVVE